MAAAPKKTTTKTVGKGQSSRMAKGRAAKAKAAEQKARLDALNGRLAEGPADRMTKAQCVAYLQEHTGERPASSLKVEELRHLVRAHRYQRDLVNPQTGRNKAGAIPTVRKLAEAKAAREAQATKQARPGRGPRGQEARAVELKLQGKRGAGTKVTDAELEAYIRKVRKAHPESSRRDELVYAYWVEGLALGARRFDAAWAAVTAADAATTTKRAAKKAAGR